MRRAYMILVADVADIVCGAKKSCGAILLHIYLQCILSYHDLHSFDAKSILSRFTHFCVEQKLIQ